MTNPETSEAGIQVVHQSLERLNPLVFGSLVTTHEFTAWYTDQVTNYNRDSHTDDTWTIWETIAVAAERFCLRKGYLFQTPEFREFLILLIREAAKVV